MDKLDMHMQIRARALDAAARVVAANLGKLVDLESVSATQASTKKAVVDLAKDFEVYIKGVPR